MALTKAEKELLSQIAKKPTVLKTASAASLKKKEFPEEELYYVRRSLTLRSEMQ